MSSNTIVATAKLRELIFAGELSAGSDHLEGELAHLLGMSRTPVREALLRLEAQGLVEVRPRKGVRISAISRKDMDEIYDVLIEIESFAAACAAKRDLSDNDLSKLSKSIIDMDAAVTDGDREKWSAADSAFHTEVVRLSGNSRVLSIAQMMSDQVRRVHFTTLYMFDVPTTSNDDHRRVRDAIRAGDPELAQSVHRKHCARGKKLLIGLLERHQLKSL